MTVYPIIPIWLMSIICLGLILLVAIKGRKKWGLVRQILIIILLFCINLRIMYISPNAQVVSNDLDILFVIDDTISMLADDYSGNKTRMDAVKSDCQYIIDELAGAKVSIITFDNEARTVIPFTRDENMVSESLEILKPKETLYAKGTTMNVARDEMLEALKNVSKNSDRSRVVFFISDGEITNGDDLESFSTVKKYIGNGAVLGYGTEKGGKMLVTNYDGEEEYMKDTTTSYPYSDAISKIDEDNLKKIAKDMGIDYIHMSSQSDIKSKIADIKKGVINKISKEDKSSYSDTYYFFVIPMVILLLGEIFTYKKRI